MRRLLTAAAVGVVLAPAAAAAAAAAPRADLVVDRVSAPPATAREGMSFGLREATANRGPLRAGVSGTRFYLTRDVPRSLQARRRSTTDPRTSGEDLLLGGVREVPALGPARRFAPRRPVTVTVPVGTPAGRYRLLACADDRGQVRERAEAPNCRPARGALTVLASVDGSTVHALSDVFEVPSEAEDAATLARLAAAGCTPQPRAAALTPARAIRALRAALSARAGASAMRAFAASPQSRTAAAAEQAAVDALRAGSPGGALVATLRAAELDPGRAAHLRNAATLANAIGRPAEALALLDGAARRADRPLPGFGIGTAAATRAIRGQALGLLGRWAEASAQLQAAATAEPLLAEARESLSAAAQCRGDAAAALAARRGGRVRRTPVPPVSTARGVGHELRTLHLPLGPEQAAEMDAPAAAEGRALVAEVGRLAERRTALEARVRAAAGLTPAEQRARRALLGRATGAPSEGDLTPGQAEVDRLVVLAEAVTHRFWASNEAPSTYEMLDAEATDGCRGSADFEACRLARLNASCRPALRSAHQEWLDRLSTAHRAAQAHLRRVSQRTTGYAANLADPDAHALAVLAVEELERALYAGLQAPVQHWTHYARLFARECVEPLAAVVPAAPQAPALSGTPQCDPLLKAQNAVLDFKAFKVKVSCEKVTLSAKLDATTWLAGFGEVSYDPRAGRVTVYGGSSGEIAGGTVKLGFKSGVYLTVGADGIQDVGWRVGPSLGSGAGPAEFQIYKDTVDMTFVGAVSSTFGG